VGEYLNCGKKCRTLVSLRDLHVFVAHHIDPVIPHAEDVAHLPICSHSIVMEYLCSCTTVVYAVSHIIEMRNELMHCAWRKQEMNKHCGVKS
jgi:hypothetical protein